MTKPPTSPSEIALIAGPKHAASRLHNARPMRLAYLLTAAATLLATGRATAAETDPTMCTGTLKVSMGLTAILDSGETVTVGNSALPTFLNQAECLCDSPNLFINTRVTTPLPAQESFQTWVGSNCSAISQRSGTPPPCEQLKDVPISDTSFLLGHGAVPLVPVPAQKLISPNAHLRMLSKAAACAGMSGSNGFHFVFFKNADMPDNVCSLALPVQTRPPAPPENLTAGSGDGAVIVTWTAPPADTIRPRFYQVLCADEAGDAIPALRTKFSADRTNLGYSVCTVGGIQRRNFTTGNTTGTDVDAGTAAADGGAISAPRDPRRDPGLGTSGEPLDGGVRDAGAFSDDAAVAELEETSGVPPFTNLDHEFICSKILQSDATSARIEGLENGKVYSFLAIGIDDYGNASPAATSVSATPLPVEDLYRRFRETGGKQGFCFVATAAYGDYDSPMVRVLREFRDRELLTNGIGRDFVDLYYRASPPAASFIAAHPTARFAARQALTPVVVLAGAWMDSAPWQRALLLTLGLFFLARRRALRLIPRSAA